jgi:hypothetical protein
MLFNHNTFIGIDPTAGHKPFSYAALDSELKLQALGKGSLDEILAFAGGQQRALAAVCAPRRPNQGLMERAEVREQLSPPPKPGRWSNFRLVEYQLRQHHISTYKTPTLEKECPNWMQMGFTLYRRLESLGYQAYPAENASLQWMEVYPHASFCALLGLSPLSKNSFEGRVQRQLVLYEEGLDVPDPMRLFEEITGHHLLQGILPLDDLHTPGELDALVAAYTAWMAAMHPEKTSHLGDPEESLVILPAASLKRSY